jgi:hypothetical protein
MASTEERIRPTLGRCYISVVAGVNVPTHVATSLHEIAAKHTVPNNAPEEIAQISLNLG